MEHQQKIKDFINIKNKYGWDCEEYNCFGCFKLNIKQDIICCDKCDKIYCIDCVNDLKMKIDEFECIDNKCVYCNIELMFW